MRNVEDLILDARRLGNKDKPTVASGVTTSGISDEEILSYLNHAQIKIQSIVSTANPQSRPFVATKTIQEVAGQQNYPVPDRVFFGKEVEQVERSSSGLDSDFRVLPKVDMFNNSTVSGGEPCGYYRAFQEIYLVPPPKTANGKLRVKFERSVDSLDKQRGAVASGALTSGRVSALTLTPNVSTDNWIAAQKDKYLCVVDKDGAVKAYNVPYTGYDTGTGVFTLPSYTPLISSSLAPAAGDFITLGKWTTSHSQLADEYEPYLIQYASMEILARSSSKEASAREAKVKDWELEIKKQARTQTAELTSIPEPDFSEWY